MKIVRIAEITESERAAVFVGREHGARVSFFVTSHRRGEGPDAHRHPYEETFLVQEGSTEFTVDGETVTVHAGTVVVVPAGAIHSFKAVGDGVTRQVNIHPVGEMVTEWIQ
ncbi:MAG: cupin domain-containing protein [Actinobacteria bacterium]|nr:cupin domain-containing protein [Actinomycetota bacterium]